jgi:hypothetical protein
MDGLILFIITGAVFAAFGIAAMRLGADPRDWSLENRFVSTIGIH